MIRRPQRTTLTATLFPYTTLFRSEVVDLLAELREEHLADFVVDLVTGDFEAAPAAGRDGDGRGDLRTVDLRVVGLRSARLVDAAVVERGDVAVVVVGQRLLRLRVRLGDGFFLRRLHVRQRPVAQSLEAAASALAEVLWVVER